MSYIEYVEINVYGQQIRLLKNLTFTVNGIALTAPFSNSNGIKINILGGNLVFSSGFGLKIVWDGDASASYSLCDAYSAFVCGLCGNADGRRLFNIYPFLNKFSKKTYNCNY